MKVQITATRLVLVVNSILLLVMLANPGDVTSKLRVTYSGTITTGAASR